MRSQTKLPHRCLSQAQAPETPNGEFRLLTSRRGLLQSLERIRLLIKSAACGERAGGQGRGGRWGSTEGSCRRGSFPDLKATGQQAWQRKSQSTAEALRLFAARRQKSPPQVTAGPRGLALPRHAGQPSGTEEVQTGVLEESASILKLFPSTISPKRRLCNVLVGAPAPLRC